MVRDMGAAKRDAKYSGAKERGSGNVRGRGRAASRAGRDPGTRLSERLWTGLVRERGLDTLSRSGQSEQRGCGDGSPLGSERT